MLTTKDAPKQAPTASPPAPRRNLSADLQFISDNQKLEGFSGRISAEVAAYRPDLKEIAASVEQFREQLSNEENAKRKPLFKR